MKTDKHLYLVVGCQGSGKSTLHSEEFSHCFRVSQDDQGKQGHKVAFEKAIKQNLDVYVDRINHTREQRDYYLRVAKQAGYKTHIIVLQESYRTCYDRILNRKNHATLKAEPKQAHDALSMYFFQYQKPQNGEADVVEFRGKDHNFVLDITEQCKDKRVFIVGDVHGMYDELITLLSSSGFQRGKDVLIFTGDLVDRGPKIGYLLEFYAENNDYSVMGNHEYKFVRYLLGRKVNSHSLKKTIDQTSKWDRNELILEIMRMPFAIKFRNNSYVVHAGINPLKTVNNQYKDELMYTRDVTLGGETAPWWNFHYGEEEIFFGHEVTPAMIQVTDNIYAMDGGACFGMELRVCVHNPDGTKEFYSQKASTAYADYREDYKEDGEEKSNMLEPFNNEYKEGYVSKKSYKDLVLYNYTPKCVYERKWNTTTRKARGIIFDEKTGELVTWVPEKFFNVNEMPETLFENLPMKDGYDVFEKVDGSFVSLSYWKGGDEWIFATRGSFESEQAREAKKIFEECLSYDLLNKGHTYIFEVIYPENRMNDGARLVVDYGSERTLVGLMVYDKSNKMELDHRDAVVAFSKIGYRTAKRYPDFALNLVLDSLKTLPATQEGFVVRFRNGLRVKFKGEEYIRMNRLLNSINVKTVWEAMENGKIPDAFMASVPEELREEVEKHKKVLEESFDYVYSEVIKEQNIWLPRMVGQEQRDASYFKEIGLFMRDNSDKFSFPQLVFPMLRGQKDNVAKAIKEIIRPSL